MTAVRFGPVTPPIGFHQSLGLRAENLTKPGTDRTQRPESGPGTPGITQTHQESPTR